MVHFIFSRVLGSAMLALLFSVLACCLLPMARALDDTRVGKKPDFSIEQHLLHSFLRYIAVCVAFGAVMGAIGFNAKALVFMVFFAGVLGIANKNAKSETSTVRHEDLK